MPNLGFGHGKGQRPKSSFWGEGKLMACLVATLPFLRTMAPFTKKSCLDGSALPAKKNFFDSNRGLIAEKQIVPKYGVAFFIVLADFRLILCMKSGRLTPYYGKNDLPITA